MLAMVLNTARTPGGESIMAPLLRPLPKIPECYCSSFCSNWKRPARPPIIVLTCDE